MSQSDDTTPYNTYSVDEETQLQSEDTLVDRNVDDVLDEGYTAPEKWSPGQGFGTTAEEEEHGESLDQRLVQEEPDPVLAEVEQAAAASTDGEDPVDAEIDTDLDAELDGAGALVDDQVGELIDDQVGADRAGRLVAPDEGAHTDVEGQLNADDVGIDSAGASAEEAAMHVVPDDA
ncbi:MAG: hypothetical protein H0U22_03340 [Geodermatophilaceae bacterium]|nr:hypothetical protein [Geodermatophilaceae bacterium]